MKKEIKDIYTTKYLYVCLNEKDFTNRLQELEYEEYKIFIESSLGILYRELGFIYEMYYKACEVIEEINRRNFNSKKEMTNEEKTLKEILKNVLRNKESIVADYKAQYESVAKKNQYPIIAPKEYNYVESVRNNYANVWTIYYGYGVDFGSSIIGTINELMSLYGNRLKDININNLGYIIGKQEYKGNSIYNKIVFELNKRKVSKEIFNIIDEEEKKILKKK
ncbi:MAG: hypothetical protein PUD59_00420 [bacterium]|nr:hypothetical protein [bacterium]